MTRAAAAVLLVALVGACSSSTPTPPPATGAPVVHVIEASVRRQGGGEALLTFVAHNAGALPDTLTAVSCACARSADIGGDATIGPEETVLFGPDGPHVTLSGFDGASGDAVDVTLSFANADDEVVTAEVAARHGT
ncbi:MAG TPA: hypothetical protein VE032_08765 [Actinomycetota bacterium]|nr:hypothetical protein [Actinomycetota bacterium]